MVCVCAQENIIPQVADGQGWSSVLVVTNTTAAPATASLSFFKDYGGLTDTWHLTFLEGTNPAALNIPAGSSLFLHTPGTAADLSQGWALLTAGPGVSAYAIYTYTQAGAPKQDASAPAIASATRFLVPFDNTADLVTTAAVVNPNPSQLTLFSNLRTSTGSFLGDTLNIPPNGHLTFEFPGLFPDTAGKEGLAEFYSGLGPFALIALRAHSGLRISFTAVPALPGAGLPIISISGGGGGSSYFPPVPPGYITDAALSIGKIIGNQGTQESVNAAFAVYKPDAWNLPFIGIDRCNVYDVTYDSTSIPPGSPAFYVDAGKLILTGPGISTGSISVTESNTVQGPSYSLKLPSGTLQAGRTYSLTTPGGMQVEAFNASATMPDNFTSNVSTITSINRGNPLTISWAGSGFENVIIGVNTNSTNSSNVHSVSITCLVPASLASYSIPTAALSKLPAVATGGLNWATLYISTSRAITGSVSSQGIATTSLTPNLVGGGKFTYGIFNPFFSIGSALTSIQ